MNIVKRNVKARAVVNSSIERHPVPVLGVDYKVKIVYNDKGYTTLPSYVKFASIEPMNIPMGFYEEGKNESMIREITGIDQFTKPIIADKEVKEVNPLTTTVSDQPSDDLPF